MKKILIISFYELKDYLLYIKEKFEEYNFSVINYPLFRYAYDSNDKIDNYKDDMNEYIINNNPDIILWWFIDVPIDVFKYIKQNNKNKIFIMYNSDDPINLNKELFDKAKIFDIIITPCKESIYLYKLYSDVQTVIFGPMGFDPSLCKPINNENINEFDKKQYTCDISIITYNLYQDKHYYNSQTVYKMDLINNIIDLVEKNNYELKLFGTPLLKELYPKYYFGEIPYFKLNLLFNYSKINLISSPFCDKSLYINEYVMPILGSGGLVMHDSTKDIKKILNENNCILYNEINYLDHIKNTLSNYDNLIEVKNNGNLISMNYTWDKWVENIIKEIGKKLFNKNVYKELYNLNIDDNELLHYWIEYGIKEKQICYDFMVPENFNSEEYIKKFNLDSNQKKSYLHWFINSKDTGFMKKNNKNKNAFDIDNSIGIIPDEFFTICHILNKIRNYKTRNDSLLELYQYSKKIPNIKINEILDKYFDIIF